MSVPENDIVQARIATYRAVTGRRDTLVSILRNIAHHGGCGVRCGGRSRPSCQKRRDPRIPQTPPKVLHTQKELCDIVTLFRLRQTERPSTVLPAANSEKRTVIQFPTITDPTV